MKVFKKKAVKELIPFNNPTWWEACKRLFKKDFPNGIIDHNDPEYDAQKIYQHWIKSYFAKK